MNSLPVEPGAWAAPLPDFSRAAVRRRLRLGDHTFSIAVSPVQREVPGEPDTHLVQLGVFDGARGDQPLTAHDLGLGAPEACANAWAYLANRLTETVVQFYAPRPRETGEPNPRLGCWGPRPDLVPLGLGESDCAIAAILGLSVWVPGARPPTDDTTFLEALRDTLVEALAYWVVLAERARPRPRPAAPPLDRRN